MSAVQGLSWSGGAWLSPVRRGGGTDDDVPGGDWVVVLVNRGDSPAAVVRAPHPLTSTTASIAIAHSRSCRATPSPPRRIRGLPRVGQHTQSSERTRPHVRPA